MGVRRIPPEPPAITESHDPFGMPSFPCPASPPIPGDLAFLDIQIDVAHCLTGHVNPEIADGHDVLGIRLIRISALAVD